MGLYILPPNLEVIVGAGESPRGPCNRVGNIAKCNVSFPEYGGYLYLGVGTMPHYVLTNDVGFVYVEMLMVNGYGFDNTFAEGQPVVGVPGCVIMNISVGTPHDPGCNLAWDSTIPALGSDAYSYTLASTLIGIFTMGGVGAAAFLVCFKGRTAASVIAQVQKQSVNGLEEYEHALYVARPGRNYVEDIPSQSRPEIEDVDVILGEDGAEPASLHAVSYDRNAND